MRGTENLTNYPVRQSMMMFTIAVQIHRLRPPKGRICWLHDSATCGCPNSCCLWIQTSNLALISTEIDLNTTLLSDGSPAEAASEHFCRLHSSTANCPSEDLTYQLEHSLCLNFHHVYFESTKLLTCQLQPPPFRLALKQFTSFRLTAHSQASVTEQKPKIVFQATDRIFWPLF